MRLSCVATASALALTAAGCGSDSGSNSGDRPPVTDYVGVMLDGKAARISPASIGGGPITLKITNQGRSSVSSVRLRPRYGLQGCVANEAAARDIPAGGTGSLNAILIEGSCELVSSDGATATLEVTAKRRSAQNVLLLP